ncbi:hypothetical protein [Streptomyces sp. AA1529]|uniref:hypothetical protein n=1 Tax=Streptomyces sp. AA1529 TaxID=1203257 RepID=UPI003D74088E
MGDQFGISACFEGGAVLGEFGVAVCDFGPRLSGCGTVGVTFFGGCGHQVDGVVDAVR